MAIRIFWLMGRGREKNGWAVGYEILCEWDERKEGFAQRRRAAEKGF
jgi:hypothetical protein